MRDNLKEKARAILDKEEHKKPKNGRVPPPTDSPDPNHEDQKSKGSED